MNKDLSTCASVLGSHSKRQQISERVIAFSRYTSESRLPQYWLNNNEC